MYVTETIQKMIEKFLIIFTRILYEMFAKYSLLMSQPFEGIGEAMFNDLKPEGWFKILR